MNTYKYYSQKIIGIMVLLFMICFVSCTDESLIPEPELEGTAVPVKIYLSAPEADKQVSSRITDEYNIQDFYLFVFNTSGKLTFKKYYTADDLKTTPNVQGGITTLDANYVEETLQSGEAYIYAVANIESDIYVGLKEELDNFTEGTICMESFVGLELKNDQKSLERSTDDFMLMSGTCKEGEKDTYTIAKNKDIKTIHLRRIDSQITFNFLEGTNCKSFKATRWYIENAPIYTYLIEHPAGTGTDCNWDASVNLGNVDNIPSDYFSTYIEIEGNLTEVYNNAFTFYMPENRKNAKSDDIDTYADRELQVKDVNRKNGAWQYAPSNGTYVVVHGIYEGKADHSKFGDDQDVTANVTYKIHLGYVDNDPADFFSKRNTKYTYNVTINGVNDIVMEVETSGDKNVAPTEKAPGATGEVVFNNKTKLFNLDAHYEQILLTFDRDLLAARYKEDFQCIVSTPFTQYGVSRTVDMDWVKVLKNENASEYFQAYPGNTSSKLQSVNDMLTDLYYASHPNDTEGKPEKDYTTFFTDDGKVTYTCYVNEFYYESVPDGSLLTVSEDVPLWKYFVNQANRKMYIVCHTDLSDDEESSIVSSEYLISQRSIQTFYNYSDKTLNELEIAYGLETINETGWLEWGEPTSNPTSWDNGWNNTKTLLPSYEWETLVDIENNGYKSVPLNIKINQTLKDEEMIANVTDPYHNSEYYLNGMKTDYQKAYVACMQRNRDNDGKKDIDDNEIRWYLAAFNQYRGIYVGEPSLSNESRLYYYPESFDITKNIKHYASSTTSSRSPVIIWAEEGTSNSTLADRISWKDGNDAPEKINKQTWNGWGQKRIHYRCIRNLGIKEINGTIDYNSYNNYVESTHASKPNSGIVTINPQFLNLNNNSQRNYEGNGELPIHTYKPYESNNKIYGQFEVNFDYHPSSNFGMATGAVVTKSYTYTYTEETRTETQTRPNRWSDDWETISYSDWSNPITKELTTTDPDDVEDGTTNSNWNTSGNTRTRTNTRIKITSVTEKETNLTGCESIEVTDGGAKWRAPNLREFTIMGMFNLLYSGGTWDHGDVCRTRMGYDNYRIGWLYTGSRINMASNGDYTQGNFVRCVRDVK